MNEGAPLLEKRGCVPAFAHFRLVPEVVRKDGFVAGDRAHLRPDRGVVTFELAGWSVVPRAQPDDALQSRGAQRVEALLVGIGHHGVESERGDLGETRWAGILAVDAADIRIGKRALRPASVGWGSGLWGRDRWRRWVGRTSRGRRRGRSSRQEREKVTDVAVGGVAEQADAVGLLDAPQGPVLVAGANRRAMRRTHDERQHLLRPRSLVPGDDHPARRGPPARGPDLADQALEELVALRSAPVVHVVDRVRRYKCKGGGGPRGEVGGQLRIRHIAAALGRVLAD